MPFSLSQGKAELVQALTSRLIKSVVHMVEQFMQANLCYVIEPYKQ